jgi:hypothetical protein
LSKLILRKKVGQKYGLLLYLVFKKLLKVNIRDWEKFAQSGHPASGKLCKRTLSMKSVFLDHQSVFYITYVQPERVFETALGIGKK